MDLNMIQDYQMVDTTNTPVYHDNTETGHDTTPIMNKTTSPIHNDSTIATRMINQDVVNEISSCLNQDHIRALVCTVIEQNKGSRCAFKLMLNKLMALMPRVSLYSQHYRWNHTHQTHSMTQKHANKQKHVYEQVMQMIYSDPIVLCHLTLCDLGIGSSHLLLNSIIREFRQAKRPLDFYAVIKEFANRTMKKKQPCDPNPVHVENLEWTHPSDHHWTGPMNDTLVSSPSPSQHTIISLCFINRASLIALRYFLRPIWFHEMKNCATNWKQETLDPVFESWLYYVHAFKDTSTSLRQFSKNSTLVQTWMAHITSLRNLQCLKEQASIIPRDMIQGAFWCNTTTLEETNDPHCSKQSCPTTAAVPRQENVE